jgi:hypothetical protein
VTASPVLPGYGFPALRGLANVAVSGRLPLSGHFTVTALLAVLAPRVPISPSALISGAAAPLADASPSP